MTENHTYDIFLEEDEEAYDENQPVGISSQPKQVESKEHSELNLRNHLALPTNEDRKNSNRKFGYTKADHLFGKDEKGNKLGNSNFMKIYGHKNLGKTTEYPKLLNHSLDAV